MPWMHVARFLLHWCLVLGEMLALIWLGFLLLSLTGWALWSAHALLGRRPRNTAVEIRQDDA